MPALQGMHHTDPALIANVPAGHEEHMPDVPAEPAAQSQWVWPAPDVSPFAHGVQEDCPACDWNVPAAHIVHAAESSASEYVPAVQSTQVAS